MQFGKALAAPAAVQADERWKATSDVIEAAEAYVESERWHPAEREKARFALRFALDALAALGEPQ